MKLAFTKMNGLGNDFMVVEWPADRAPPPADLIRRWADRRRGIGFDQLLLLTSGPPAGGDASYRNFNADGGEVEQCGNGARCFARFVLDEGLTAKREIRVETASGVIVPRVEDSGQVTVDMGPARLGWDEIRGIPVRADEKIGTGRFEILCAGDGEEPGLEESVEAIAEEARPLVVPVGSPN